MKNKDKYTTNSELIEAFERDIDALIAVSGKEHTAEPKLMLLKTAMIVFEWLNCEENMAERVKEASENMTGDGDDGVLTIEEQFSVKECSSCGSGSYSYSGVKNNGKLETCSITCAKCHRSVTSTKGKKDVIEMWNELNKKENK